MLVRGCQALDDVDTREVGPSPPDEPREPKDAVVSRLLKSSSQRIPTGVWFADVTHWTRARLRDAGQSPPTTF